MAENTTTEVITGGAVMALAVGFFLYATQSTGIGGATGSYELTASFRSVEGVNVGTDVRLAGVKVGTVTALELNPQTFRADARFTMKKGIELPDDSAVLVSTEGLLGGTFVEIIPGGSPFNLSPGDEMLETQGAVSLISLLMKVFTATADETGR
ncbi:outer membrane lipid asymmetry maintenance protein MlaD [Rhodovulum sp.]|uniref:outer membrane lipid asymmetry maintenance protein MlaD n=1 Tax=Rhodovulum sp. TaxID=34009 RepID=UPI0017FABE77|nr:outer membrane lipid asymmetry maintenance protein MlaD [Rhodovulum sp.]HDR28704.1 outer membrane lipid asymmetry maintenance protein MlaD [Rhodovulum sp.]